VTEELGTPRLRELPRFPVTAGVLGLSIAVTIAWLVGADIEALVLDVRAFHGEPWRLVTSVLPHVDPLHLAFNAFWVWRFGAAIERRFGHVRALLLLAALAVSSGAAEMAVFVGGVGLSGVGYGLFGLLLALRGRDPGLPRIEPGIALLFLGWFFVCVGTTMIGWMPVANVAHAIGFLQGFLLGAALGSAGLRRIAAATVAVVLLGLSLACASVLRPWVSRSPEAGRTSASLGYRALVAGDPQAAVEHFERALRLGDAAEWWYDYGLALVQVGRHDEGVAALRRAHAIDPSRRHREALEQLTGQSP
jgi:membrane associated rhomboid family serine protease